MTTEREWKFKEWYKDHGDNLNKDRRDRYSTDPEYRARVLETNKLSRQKRKQEQKEERSAEAQAIKVRVKQRSWKEFEAHLDAAAPGDGDAKLYSIGALAKALNRSVQAVRLWERKGIIPPTPLRNAKNDRLYTAQMVATIYRLLEQQGKLEDTGRTGVRPRSLLGTVQLADGSVIETPVFRVGVFAAAIGRSVVTLEQMERRGVIPATPFRTESKYRVYVAPMIEAVKQALDKRGDDVRGEQEWSAFREEVISAWKHEKLIGAKLLKVRVDTDTSEETEDNAQAGG